MVVQNQYIIPEIRRNDILYRTSVIKGDFILQMW
jgi:hypothetical protein